ncbi:MAG: hypothetical protein DCF15_09675 [Phormidesmis priestleyi]|uniref:Tetratricopeptide repeat protein n=1 Tax=Phormidesmis priestleyi TaxID=268141 RepID=A0A2W4XGG1_9CYAN|nr:MAG: hypothetical protein DCF15_09675 [Phormidesmis priestleyi]
MIAIQPKSRQILGVNQQTYQALKASLSLNLRRQLLIAVCDDVSLQQRLANQLEADISKDLNGSKNYIEGFEEGANSLEQIILDPDEGDLPQQVANWVRQTLSSPGRLSRRLSRGMPTDMLPSEPLPILQILGVEQMTHQSAIAQHHFLRSLENVEALLPRLNTSLLIWLPWPWLRTIQQSSPTFWTWRSGVFEFASEYGGEYGNDYDGNSANNYASEAKSSELPAELPADLTTEWTSESSAELTSEPFAATVDSRLTFSGGLYGESLESESAPDADIALAQAAVFEGNLFENQVNVAISASAVEAVTAVDTANAVDNGLEKESADSDHSLEAIAPSSAIQAPVKTPPKSLPETPSSVDDFLAEGLDYRSQIESGVRDLALIEAAIWSYERGLSHLADSDLVTQPARASDHHAANIYLNWSSGLNDLGTLYWLKAQQLIEAQPSIDCMLHSIQLYKEALNKITLAEAPLASADSSSSGLNSGSNSSSAAANSSPASLAEQLYSNMGAVYSMLATYDEPIIYLQQAAAAYLNALLWVSVETASKAYGILQNSLGSVYWYLSHYDQVAVNLNQAIAAYNQALLGYSPQQHPLDYAAVKNNLGIAYWSLAKHEQPALYLNYAIAAYRDALNYRTVEVDPSACATTYNNLALAYWDLSKLDINVIGSEQRIRYQKNAIAAFESVLKISQSTQALSAADASAIYHCLGDMHNQMAALATAPSEVASHLKKSLCNYVRAIEGLAIGDLAFQERLAAIVANVKAHHQKLGLPGQQLALAQVPSALLSEVLVAL